ncbi:hypothetical protein Q3G72_018808 [Acer saccharum]|nr:hypothetical protein Q3G72_018808 [Acer saccharum]
MLSEKILEAILTAVEFSVNVSSHREIFPNLFSGEDSGNVPNLQWKLPVTIPATFHAILKLSSIVSDNDPDNRGIFRQHFRCHF